MELDARKAKLVREILTEVNSIELLEKISKYLHKHLQQTMNHPCQFTVEELEQVLEQSQEDIKKGNYNPFSRSYIMEGFDEQVRQMLIMMIAEVCREFEKLPIIKYTDILRNILYSGVWCRFEAVSGKRKKEQEKENV